MALVLIHCGGTPGGSAITATPSIRPARTSWRRCDRHLRLTGAGHHRRQGDVLHLPRLREDPQLVGLRLDLEGERPIQLRRLLAVQRLDEAVRAGLEEALLGVIPYRTLQLLGEVEEVRADRLQPRRAGGGRGLRRVLQ